MKCCEPAAFRCWGALQWPAVSGSSADDETISVLHISYHSLIGNNLVPTAEIQNRKVFIKKRKKFYKSSFSPSTQEAARGPGGQVGGRGSRECRDKLVLIVCLTLQQEKEIQRDGSVFIVTASH